MTNYEALMRANWSSAKSLTDKIKESERITAMYYAEKRDHSAREQAKKGPSNLDPNNPAIKQVEEYAKSIQNKNFKKH